MSDAQTVTTERDAIADEVRQIWSNPISGDDWHAIADYILARVSKAMTAAMSNDFPKLGIKTAELAAHVEALIEEAATKKPEAAPLLDLGAVNWGNIGVLDVEYRLSMIGPVVEPYCVVLVEEAEPDGRFSRWLNERIDRVRYPNTYVQCQW